LKATKESVQQKAKQVEATATLRNIMTSGNPAASDVTRVPSTLADVPSRPLRIAANVTSSVENIKTSPPHERKKLPRASVGGRDGRMEFGGPSHRKKYVKHRMIENPTSKFPQRA
jgi:hypothetical protein